MIPIMIVPCEFCGKVEQHEHDPAVVECIKMLSEQIVNVSSQSIQRTNELEARITKIERTIKNLGEQAFDIPY